MTYNVRETKEATVSVPTTRRAATRRVYGGVEAIAVEQLPVPTPSAGEVVLAVRAAGIDRGALHLLTGTPLVARLALGLRRPRQPILGLEVAGEVVAVGPDATSFAVGDRVFGTAAGSFATYAVARADRITQTPAGVSDEQAATLGISGGTALIAVRDRAQVQAGQRVLVLGASGGVGSFATQLAVQAGAEVTAVASAAKADFVRSLGAAYVHDYRAVGLDAMGGPFDAISDIGGNHRLRELRRALTRSGTLVIVGGEEGGRLLGGIHRNVVADLLNPFVPQRLGWFVQSSSGELSADLGRLVEQGAITPAVDRVVGLDGVAVALAAMERGELRGKVVVRP